LLALSIQSFYDFSTEMNCLIFSILLFSPIFAIQPTVIVHGGAGSVEPERVNKNTQVELFA
jgi:hypothetical protein